jgi:hypothetical protein
MKCVAKERCRPSIAARGDAAGAAINASISGTNVSLGYSGAMPHASSYGDGRGDKGRSTQHETRNHALTENGDVGRTTIMNDPSGENVLWPHTHGDVR